MLLTPLKSHCVSFPFQVPSDYLTVGVYEMLINDVHLFSSTNTGVIWPVLGMPKSLRYISYVLPTTYGAEAMRSIMERGTFFISFCSSCFMSLFQLIKFLY